MKKEIIKEYNGRLLVLDIMLYCIIAVTGYILLSLNSETLLDPVKYVPSLFYTFGFFSLLVYFFNRGRGDYELLIFGFINICVATFILIYSNYPNAGFILADAVLIYAIANVVNKGYACRELIKNRDINFFIKISVTILLFVLGVLVVSAVYNKIEAGTLILGYYFIIFGLLSLLEPLITIIFGNKKVEKYVLDFLAYDEDEPNKEVKKEEKKEVKKVTKKTTKKTTKK